jgi:hypothetical protein
MLKRSMYLLAGVLLAASLWAADVTGKWTAEMRGPQGNTRQTSMDLKADGNTLTGTVEGMRGGSTPISDGKIDGDNISFSVVREFQGNQFKMNYKGVVKGDTIHFTVSREGGEGRTFEFDAKRGS